VALCAPATLGLLPRKEVLALAGPTR